MAEAVAQAEAVASAKHYRNTIKEYKYTSSFTYISKMTPRRFVQLRGVWYSQRNSNLSTNL